MSEPQPRESSRPKSQLERRDEVLELCKNPDIPDQELTRVARAKLSWGDWVLYEYGPYWLAVGVVLLDLFIVSEVAYLLSIKGDLGILAMILFMGVLLALEWYLYEKYWPKAPFFRRKQF